MVVEKRIVDKTFAPWFKDDTVIWCASKCYKEREIPKKAKWLWNSHQKIWWTTEIDRASELWKYAVNGVQQELRAVKEKRDRSIKLSTQSNTNITIPKPDNGMDYFPFQKVGVLYANDRKNTLIGDEMGLGKEQPVDSLVVTPEGFKKIGELSIGDYVIAVDGTKTKVTGVFPQGEKDVYRVWFSDNVYVDCGLEHLWAVRNNCWKRYQKNNGGDGWRVLSVKNLLERKIIGKDGQPVFRVPRQEAVSHSEKHLGLDPYFVGVLIGDGCYCSSYVTVTLNNLDFDDIFNKISFFDFSVRQKRGCKEIRYLNYVLKYVRAVGLSGKSKEKSIPKNYLCGSIEQRKQLLYGLLDTDGSCSKNRTVFHTRSNQLANDVKQLVDSLGGFATIRKYDRREKGVDIQVRIQTQFCPFTVKRKAKEWWPASKKQVAKRGITRIEKVGFRESVCISVEHSRHLYLTGKSYVATHNTIQAIGFINTLKDLKKVLVVCPNIVKLNWKIEFEKWLLRDMSVDVGSTNGLPDTDIIIVNYETLSKFTYQPTTREVNERLKKDNAKLLSMKKDFVGGKRYLEKHFDYKLNLKMIDLGDKILTLENKTSSRENYLNPNYNENFANINWDCLVIDECHYIKNNQTIRGKSVYRLKANRILFLSGTPLVNRPIDLWPMLNFLDSDTWKDKYKYYLKRYCNNTTKDANKDNLPELQRKLRETIMIRRLKKDVLKDLPPKIRQIIHIESSEISGILKDELAIYEKTQSLKNELAAKVEISKTQDNDGDYKEAVKRLRDVLRTDFSELAKIRSETAKRKIPYVIKHLEMMLDQNKKIVFFCHHQSMLNAVHNHFKKSVKIDGGTKVEERQRAVDLFQNNDEINLFCGSITACGVGITLTSANVAIFGEFDWVPGNMAQAEDRIHRISQKNSVLVQLLVLENSIDAKMAQTIVKKMEVIDLALDSDQSENIESDIVISGDHVSVNRKKLDQLSSYLSNSAIKSVFEGIQILSKLCDGANRLDGNGFNKIDAKIGNSLASFSRLSKKQSMLGLKLCYKYRKQLPDNIRLIIESEAVRMKEINSVI